MASKYERAVEVRSRNSNLIDAFNRQVTTKHRDKTGLRWHFVRTDSYMHFTTDMHSGYYGSSSVGDDGSDAAGREIAKTLDTLKGEIILRTIDRLEREIMDAALEAREEAESIIAKTAATA